MRKVNLRIVEALLLAGLFAGCGKDESADGAKTYAEMSWKDVIVQVNDHKLRKREMEEYWALNMKMLGTLPEQERKEAKSRMAEDMTAYPNRFIEQSLLVDEAKRLKVLTESQAMEGAEILLSAVAKAKGLTKDEFFRQYSDTIWYHRKVAENRTWINALVAKDIPPIMETTPAVVSNYVGAIAEETAAMHATNRATVAMLEGVKRDVMAGKADFTNVAEQISISDWNRGDVSRAGLDAGAEVRGAIFKARAGEVVGPFETKEGYELYRVVAIIPGERDSKGREVQPETRRIHCIEVAKADEPVQYNFEQAAQDISRQMQMAAIAQRLELLKTNGLNRIVWPHGKNLWGLRKRKDGK